MKQEKNKNLIKALLLLDNDEAVSMFLKDLLTKKEIEDISNRLEAARLLNKNVIYTEIIEKTGLSSTTIARISKWLQKGTGGFKKVLNRLDD